MLFQSKITWVLPKHHSWKTCRRLDKKEIKTRIRSGFWPVPTSPRALVYHSIDLSFAHLVFKPFFPRKIANMFQANNTTPRQATNSPLNSLSFCCGSSLWGPQESKVLPCHASLCNLSDIVRNWFQGEGRTHDAYTDYRATLKMMEATWSKWELHTKCSSLKLKSRLWQNERLWMARCTDAGYFSLGKRLSAFQGKVKSNQSVKASTKRSVKHG